MPAVSVQACCWHASVLKRLVLNDAPGVEKGHAVISASAVLEQSATAALPCAAFSICRVWTAFSSCSQGEEQLGTSLAAAVVTAVLFFIVLVGGIVNFGAVVAAAGDWRGCMDDDHAATLISTRSTDVTSVAVQLTPNTPSTTQSLFRQHVSRGAHAPGCCACRNVHAGML